MSGDHTLAERLRAARREKGWKQRDLAGRLGVSQAAISQFERGNERALSRQKVLDALSALGLDPAAGAAAGPATTLKFCEHADCLANVAYRKGERTIVRPRMLRAAAAVPTHCPECAEVLMDHCPNDDYARPVEEGGFCVHCGSSYVGAPAHDAAGLEHVRERTRLRIVS